MAVTYRLWFTPDISTAELRRFAGRLGEWMAEQSEAGSAVPGADDDVLRDRLGGLSEWDESESISGEQISVGPGLFGPERSLEIVLHPGLLFDLPQAEQSLVELCKEF